MVLRVAMERLDGLARLAVGRRCYRALLVIATTSAISVPWFSARAQSERAQEALLRFEETMAIRVESGTFDPKSLQPLIVVSIKPYYESSRASFPGAALTSLNEVFYGGAMRLCEACEVPRTYVEDGYLELSTGSIDLPEIIRLDNAMRGTTPPAKTAVWIDETPAGIAYRFVDLSSGRVVLAANVDPDLHEEARVAKSFTLSKELRRRARGESITHAFVDVTMYPGQHMSLDWTDQWGDTNTNLSGVCMSLYGPVLGLGAVYYRVLPEALNLAVGGKVIMSVPTALVRGITGEDVDIIDPLLTGVFLLRIPFGHDSNYAGHVAITSTGTFGVGISLLNTSLLPFLP